MGGVPRNVLDAAEGPGSRETSWPGWRGRAQEWALVAGLLRAARVGRGGVVLVEGQPGVGKSRMLDVAAATATRWGFRVVRGVADELAQLMPLAPLISALEESGCPLRTGDNGVPGPVDRRLLLLERLQGPLEALVAHGPVLLTLDDVHWADPMTLLALRSLTVDFASTPLIWMLARTTGGGDALRLDRMFNTLEREGATRIRLKALDGAAVAEVVTDVLGAAPEPDVLALADIADANPFLLVDLIEKLKHEGGFRIADGRASLVSTRLPPAQAVTRERLEELSGPTRHMLQVAGVLGRSFSVKDLAEMLGETTGDLLPMLEEAMSAGIVESAGHELAFRHELLWEAVTETLSSAVRRALHREAGEMLLKRGGSTIPAAAHLIHSAGHGDMCALRALDRAAREVLRSSPQTAADLAKRALELTDAADPDWVNRAAVAVDALTAVGRLCEAADLARPALSRAPPVLAHRLRCALAYILLLSGRPADAVSQAESLLSREDVSRDLRDVAEWTVFWGLISLNDLREGRRRAEAVLADRDGHSDTAVMGALLMLSRCAMIDGRLDDSFTHLHEALRIGNSGTVEAVQRPYARLLLGHLHRCLCQFDAADLAIWAAEEEIEALGVTVLAAQPALFRARVKLAAASLDDAAAEAEAGMRIADDMGTHGFIRVGLSILAYIAVRRGDMDAAGRNIRRYAREPGAAGMLFGSACEWVEAVVAEALGDRERAMDILGPTYTDADKQRWMLVTAPLAAAWMTRLALASGNRTYAQTTVDTAGHLARRNPAYPIFAAAAAHARGLLHADPGDLAFAAANHPQLWERASAAEDLGVLLTTSGACADRERAISSLDQAHDGYQQIGALRDAARARARLRALGVRRRHWAQSHQQEFGWDSLTDTERAVAELIARGLTNRRAAAQMFLSPHTVSTHLRRIFAKLDITSRAELARIFAEERPERDS
ncbi:AAA family ATPase [Microbispora bryophytorum]|uniref:helix-turn-helix transcriptional regulator n=1 Tax=Microbispora bryophytorum TaxID=1460882 RepID=UPI00340BFC48